MIRFPFETEMVEVDEWGNRKFLCPACGSIRKEDGLLKHITYKAKMPDSKEDQIAHQKLKDLVSKR